MRTAVSTTSTTDALAGQVQALYDQYRTALCKGHYYGRRLHKTRRVHRLFDGILALFIPGTVGFWYLFEASGVALVGMVVVSVLALLTVLPPATRCPRTVCPCVCSLYRASRFTNIPGSPSTKRQAVYCGDNYIV